MQPAEHLEPSGQTLESLRVAAQQYYWKPSRAFVRAFMLDEYVQAGARFDHPILDLGCGDGIFGAALRQRGVLDSVDVCLDASKKELRRLAGTPAFGAVCGDLTRLPLAGASIGSVFSNAALSSLMTEDEADVDRSLQEVQRVLRDRGVFVFTVAIPRFNEHLLIRKYLDRLGAKHLARRYVRRVNRKHAHTQLFTEERWLEKLKYAGFTVEQVRYFFTRRQARWYGALVLLRGLPALRILRLKVLQQIASQAQAWLLSRLLGGVFSREQALPQEQKRHQAGFLLIVARKPGPVQEPANKTFYVRTRRVARQNDLLQGLPIETAQRRGYTRRRRDHYPHIVGEFARGLFTERLAKALYSRHTVFFC